MNLRESILSAKDEKYAEFQSRAVPTIDPDSIIGVRIPDLRMIEKEFRNSKEAESFIRTLPHEYYDENILHGAFISNMKSNKQHNQKQPGYGIY